MPAMTRRAFLALLARGLAASELLRVFPFLPVSARAASAQDYPLAAVAAGTNEDSTADILKTALDGIGGLERFVRPGMAVAIKPNATWAYPPRTASSSDPDMLRAVIRMVRAAGAGRIVVMDHCSIDPGAADALRVSGIGQVVREEEVEGIFPDRNNAPLSTYTSIELPHGKAFQKLGVIKAALEVDLRINLGVAKSHNVTKMTMCLKHMMGFLQQPGLLHANLEQGIADLSTPSPIQAKLHILEAIRVRLPYKTYRVCAGPETDETNPNVVRRVNQIVAGTDPVLIDAYGCLSYFDVLPEELTHVRRAYEAGLGELDVESALSDGRLRIFKVGEPVVLATSVPEPTLAETPPGELPAIETPAGTATPYPTATLPPQGQADLPVGIQATVDDSCSQVVDPRPFLNTALIPGAAVITGAGLVAAARLQRRRSRDQDKAGESAGSESDEHQT